MGFLGSGWGFSSTGVSGGSAADLEARMFFHEELIGPKNNVNRTFTTSQYFLPDTIRVFHDGRRLVKGESGNVLEAEFYVAESGGAGTGYDTVVLIRFSPRPRSGLWAHFHTPAP